MSYVDGYSGALAEIGQIQATLSSSPLSAPSSGFEEVLAQVSSISALLGTSAPTAPGGPSLSGSFGYPLEEGGPIGPTSNAAGAGGPVGTPMGYELATADAPLTGQAAASSGTGGPSQSGGFGQAVVADAEKYLGVPYQWGGTDPAQGVDCSGLVQDVFANLGVSVPRTSQQQVNAGVAVPSLADAEPGDLLFFPGSDGTASAPGHVGIYVGNGQMIDAPYTGANVRVDPVGDPTAIRRVKRPSAPPLGNPTTSDGAPDEPAALPTNGASPYSADFASAAASTGVPEALLSAVASTESSFQPGAVSSAGAEGLMQLMPSTASSLGVDPFSPGQAIGAAADLLSSYHQQFGSWSLALAAYNAGPAAVAAYSGIPPYPQTQSYVQKVLSRAAMEDQ